MLTGHGGTSRWWSAAVLTLLFGCVPLVFGQRAETGAAIDEQPTEEKSYAAGDLYLDGSRVYARVGKVGLGHEHAVVGRLKQGHLTLGATQDGGELTFDMTSFVADTDAARKYLGLEGATDASTQQQVTANMLGTAVLDAEHFPTAKLRVKSARLTEEKSKSGRPVYQIEGDFTLHGKTKPIRIMAEAEDERGWVHLRGGFSVLQSEYGIKPFTKAFGAIGVADRVDIWGDLWVAQAAKVSQQSDGAQR
ncbi:MAG: YceI family protein [Pirellulales bacterium]